LNLHMTQQSLVLLKNEKKTLPFPRGKRIAVVGPHGDNREVMIGNYIGQICPTGMGVSCAVSPFQAIQAANHGGQTVFSQGCTVADMDTSQFVNAITAVKNADLVVVFLGLNQSVEAEVRDRVNITLPGVQDQFAQAVLAVGKPTVFVLFNGGAVAIEWLHDNADAILEAFYPGFQGGTAVASAIFGDYNPGGKMPYTTYKADYVKQVDMKSMDMRKAPGRTYKYFQGDVLWPFGFGLSYTKFSLALNNRYIPPLVNSRPDPLDLFVMVTNNGSVAGDEVVQLYFTPPSSVDPALKQQLWAFERVHLAAGASTTVSIPVDFTNFIIGDNAGNLVSYPGNYMIKLTNGADQTIHFNITISGTTRIIENSPY